MNKVLLMGEIGTDPETKEVGQSLTLTTFTVVTKQVSQSGEKVSTVTVKAFGKTADYCSEHLGKGDRVFIEGKIDSKEYTKDGVTRSFMDVMALVVNALDKKIGASNEQPTESKLKPAQQAYARQQQQNKWAPKSKPVSQLPKDEDLIPF